MQASQPADENSSNGYPTEHTGEVIPDMVLGMRSLLEMHNTHELYGLCNALAMRDHDNDSKEERIERIFHEFLADDRGYVKVLSYVWEGIIIEYLRAEGVQLKFSLDPKLAVITHWRRRRQVPITQFVPLYVPRTFLAEPTATPRDEKIESFLGKILGLEHQMKQVETAIRRDRDFRNLLSFMSTIYELRKVEKQTRDYLIEELKITRSRLQHSQNALQDTSAQFSELENRHDKLLASEIQTEAIEGALSLYFCETAAIEAATATHFEDLYWEQRFMSATKIRDLTSRLRSTIKELGSMRTEFEQLKLVHEATKEAHNKAADEKRALCAKINYLLTECATAEMLRDSFANSTLTQCAAATLIGEGGIEARNILENIANNPDRIEIQDLRKQSAKLMFLMNLVTYDQCKEQMERASMGQNDTIAFERQQRQAANKVSRTGKRQTPNARGSQQSMSSSKAPSSPQEKAKRQSTQQGSRAKQSIINR